MNPFLLLMICCVCTLFTSMFQGSVCMKYTDRPQIDQCDNVSGGLCSIVSSVCIIMIMMQASAGNKIVR